MASSDSSAVQMPESSSAVQQPLAASNGEDEGWQVVRHARHKQQQHSANPIQTGASLSVATNNGSTAAAAQRRLMSEAHKSPVDPVNGRIRCRACGKAFSAYSFLAQHLKQRHFGLNSDDAMALEYQHLRNQQQGRTSHSSSNVPLTAADFPSLSTSLSPAKAVARKGTTPAVPASCWGTQIQHPVETGLMTDACLPQHEHNCAPVATSPSSLPTSSAAAAAAHEQCREAGSKSGTAAKAQVCLQQPAGGQSSRNSSKPKPSASHTLDLGQLIQLSSSNNRKQQQQRRPPNKQRPQDKKQRLTADQVRLILAAAAEQGLKVKKGAAELKRNSRGKLSRLKRLIICERADRQLAAAGHALESAQVEAKLLEQQLQALEHRLEAAQQLQQLLAQSGGDSSGTAGEPGSDLAGDTSSSTPGAPACCAAPSEPSNTVAAAGSQPPRCDPQTAARVSVAALQLAVQRAGSALAQAQKVVDKHQAEKQTAQALWNKAYKVEQQETCGQSEVGKASSCTADEQQEVTPAVTAVPSAQSDGKAGTSDTAAIAAEVDDPMPAAAAAELPSWLGQLGSESDSESDASDVVSISSGDDSEDDSDGTSSDGEGLVGFVDVLSKWAANMPQQQLARAFKSARRSDAKAAVAVLASPSLLGNALEPTPAAAGAVDGDRAAGGAASSSRLIADYGRPPGLGNGGSSMLDPALEPPAAAAAASQMPLAPVQPCSLADEAESSSGCDSSDEEGEGGAPSGHVLPPCEKPQLLASHDSTPSQPAAGKASSTFTAQQASSKLLSDSAESSYSSSSNVVTTPMNTEHALTHRTDHSGATVTRAAAKTPGPFAAAAVVPSDKAHSSSSRDLSAPADRLPLQQEPQHHGPLGRLQLQVPPVTQTSSNSSTPYQQPDNDLHRPNLSIAASPVQQNQLAALSPLRVPTKQPPPPPPKQQQVVRNLSSSRSIGTSLDPVHPGPPTAAVAGGFGASSRAPTEHRKGASTTSSDSTRSGGLVNNYLDRTTSGNSSVTSRCVMDAVSFRTQANETVAAALHCDPHHSAAGHDAHAASLAALQQQQQQQLLQLQALQQQQQVVSSLQGYPGYPQGVSRMSSMSRAPDSISSAALAAGAMHLGPGGQAAQAFGFLNGAGLPLDSLDSSSSLASAAVAAMAGLTGTSPISTLYAGSSIAGGSLTGGSPFGGSPFGGSPMGGSPLGGSPSHIAFSAAAAAGHVSTSATMLGSFQQFPGQQQQQLLLEASMLPDRTAQHSLTNGLGYGLPATQQQQQGAEDDQAMALQLAAAVAAQHSDPTTAAAAAAAAMVSFRQQQQQEQQQLQELQRQQQLLLAVEQMLLTCGHTLDSTTSSIISAAIAQGDVDADTLHQLLSQLLSGSSTVVSGVMAPAAAHSGLAGPEGYSCWPQAGEMYPSASGAGLLPSVDPHTLSSSHLDSSGFNAATNLVASPQPSQRSTDGAIRSTLASPGHTMSHQQQQQLMLHLQPPPPPPLARGVDPGVAAMLQRQQPPPPPPPAQQQQQLGNAFMCSLCQVSCNSMQTLQQHLESKRHIAKAAYATLAAVQQPGQLLQQQQQLQNAGASLLMAAGPAGSSPESASLLDQCMNSAMTSAVAAAAAGSLLAEGTSHDELLSGLDQAFSPSAPALSRMQQDLRNSNISSASTNSFSAGSLLPFPALTLGGGSSSSSNSIIGHHLRGRSPSGRSPTAMSPTGFHRGLRGLSPQGGSRGASPRGGSRGASPGGSPHAVTYVGPNAAVQAYCTQEITPELNAAVTTLLTSVKGQQDKAIAKSSGKAALKRCYVCGLREVCKAIKGGKAVAVLLAPNIESNEAEGGLNDSVQDIITACTAADIPVVFALSRKKMGEVYGFRKRMSAIALLDVGAVQGALNQVLQLAAEGRRLWAANHPERLAAAAAAAVVSEVAVALGGAGARSANASPAVATEACVTVS